jgi:hypothetical protein
VADLAPYRPSNLPQPTITNRQIRKLSTHAAEQIQALQQPVAAAYETMRQVHRQTEAEVALAHQDAEMLRRFLESVDAPAEALANLQVRTNNYEVYLSQLQDVAFEKVLGVMRQLGTNQQPEQSGPLDWLKG